MSRTSTRLLFERFVPPTIGRSGERTSRWRRSPRRSPHPTEALMKVTMILADSAQAVDGKLYVLGGGWSLAGPGPTPMALAVKIEVPWDRGNMRHHLTIEL